ncbi:MAG: hypothetical protein HY744_03105 [Deltaproteobacteria bacterium]|nr:hypothetical protein [Deltaproteobacteria bacterium]
MGARHLALLAVLVAAGCHDPRDRFASGEPGSSPAEKAPALPVASPGRSTGIKECDEYFQKLKDCKGMPEASKAALEQAVETIKKSIAAAPNDAAKQAMAEGCKQGMAGLTACQ